MAKYQITVQYQIVNPIRSFRLQLALTWTTGENLRHEKVLESVIFWAEQWKKHPVCIQYIGYLSL